MFSRALAAKLFIASSLIVTCATSHALTLKIATLSPDGSEWMRIMKAASDDIKAKTDGRVKFRYYPGGVMGNDEAVMRKIRLGQLHGAMTTSGALAKAAPNTQIYNLPLFFKSMDEVDHVRGELDGYIRQEFEDSGWVNFGLAEGGFGYVMSKEKVVATSDLPSRKVWVPANDDASLAAAETFDITPIPLSLGDVLAGLQTSLIDTVASSPLATIALQWHTQINYMTDLPLLYFYGVLAIQKKHFKKVSIDDQKIVREIMGEAFKKIDKQNRIDNEKALAALKNQGITLLKPTPEQVAQWQEKADASVDTYLKQGKMDPAIHTRINAIINDYRASKTK